MLAPEERHRIEAFPQAEHIPGRGLALPFGHHPVLDPNLVAGVRIGPPRDVAGREDAGHAGLEVLVHGDAAVDRQPRPFGDRNRRPHADAEHEKVALERGAVAERDHAPLDAGDGLAQVERDALLLVHLADEASDLRPHHALQRLALGRDDMDRQPAGAERGRHFQADEAGAYHHHRLRASGPRDNRLAVGKRPQVVDRRAGCPGNVQPHRLRPGGDQQRLVAVGLARLYADHLLLRIDRRHPRVQHQVDAVLRVKLTRAQRNPIVLRGPGEKVLRQVRPVARRRFVRAQHRQRPVVTRTAEHLGGRQPRAASPDDDNGLRHRPRTRWRWRRDRGSLQFFPDVGLVADQFDAPARDRIERRRTQRFAGAEAEAGVMPRTAHRVPHDQPLGQRPVIVRAVRADGEQAIALPDQDRFLRIHTS